jgi:small subunit ribosomal protein S6
VQEGYTRLWRLPEREIQKGGVVMAAIKYESTFICSPELPTEKLDEIVEKVKKIVETSGGNIVVTQQLGRKRLAYPIRKFREGNYVYMELTGPGAMVSALETFYKVNDAVIRYLTVQVKKKKIVPAKPAEPAKPASEEVKPNEPSQPSTSGAE